jgi:hypothetical protein
MFGFLKNTLRSAGYLPALSGILMDRGATAFQPFLTRDQEAGAYLYEVTCDFFSSTFHLYGLNSMGKSAVTLFFFFLPRILFIGDFTIYDDMNSERFGIVCFYTISNVERGSMTLRGEKRRSGCYRRAGKA